VFLLLLFFKTCRSVFVQPIVSLSNAYDAHAGYSIITSIWDLQFLMSVPTRIFREAFYEQGYSREVASLFREKTGAQIFWFLLEIEPGTSSTVDALVYSAPVRCLLRSCVRVYSKKIKFHKNTFRFNIPEAFTLKKIDYYKSYYTLLRVKSKSFNRYKNEN